MVMRSTIDAARGKWRGILMTLGVPESALKNKHGPCPLCGGKDRFRWDNQHGRGTYFCNRCGAGDGVSLAMAYTGKTFADVCREIDGILGNIPVETKRETREEDHTRALRSVYLQTQPMQPGDLADRYLASRGLALPAYPKALRFAPELKDGEGGTHPAMVALITVSDQPVSMHRTFLRRDGKGKADIPSPRKLMPGSLPDGACVALSDHVPGEALGIAEGIETALAVSRLFDLPCWAALNTSLLKKWTPPHDCPRVRIFADHDRHHGGAAAAFALAHRLETAGIPTAVEVPNEPGTDFADALFQLNRKEDQ